MPHGVGLFLFPASAFVVCHTFRILNRSWTQARSLHFKFYTIFFILTSAQLSV